jgi:hypothetical protein
MSVKLTAAGRTCGWIDGARLGLWLVAALFVVMGTFGVSQAARATKENLLIDILIRKGILTEQEAEEIRREAGELEKQRQQELVEAVKEEGAAIPDALKDLNVGALWYLDYSNGQKAEPGDEESSFNRFRITRGYLTVKKQLLPWFGTRITMDTHQDEHEDWKVRLKYLYGELRPPDLGPFTDMKSEIGMGHIPWLDFEEHINPYRCQGTMAIERAGVFNSADLGLSLRGYFGGKLEHAVEKTGSHHYDGRYGSWHLGVYNGGGYHADENNNNKVFEGRISVRPVPDVIPGLQLSYFGLCGEGNDDSNAARDWPDYVVNLGMVSYQNPWVILTGQYFRTEGNAKGEWVDAEGEGLDTEGYSFFGNVKLPVLDRRLSLFGRYDHFDQDDDGEIGDEADYDMYIGGLAYDIYKGNLILLSFETTDYADDAGIKSKVPVRDNRLGDEQKVQAVLQIKY